MNTVPVASFLHHAPATSLRDRLQQTGIRAEIRDGHAVELFWFVTPSSGDATLEVPPHDSDRARRQLLEWDQSDGALRDAVRCPRCHSLNLDFPQFTRRSMLPNMVIGLLASLWGVEKDYYCRDCHLTWPRGGRRERLRPHQAPEYFLDRR